MREILFRGKRTHDGKWVYGDYTSYCQLDRIYAHDDFQKIVWFVDGSTVSCFTGLTDKNGTKVFEGDILSAHLDDLFPQNETRQIVIWHDSGWYGKNLDGVIDDFENGFIKQFTIIGNVHDNPELLEL